eukprot:TRINITY_DN10891_c0_g1_i1.p1 TRINITY_DN10891_c0_g1~~TRINITY_DN10891_c0_g1_i1.p1  ORF type:complete len:478 (-),score=101.84 TRINITY_DN10891_c0_g1_i1:92-1525(-)
MKKVLLIFSLLLVGILGVHNETSGLRFTVHQSLLDEMNDLIVNELIPLLKNITFPDITGNYDVPVFGEVQWWIKNFHVKDIEIAESSTKIEKLGIRENIQKATLILSAEYKWRKTHIIHPSDHGTMDINIKGASINFEVDIGEANLRPTIKVGAGGVKFHLDALSIVFHGKIAWIYNDLVSAVEGKLTGLINTYLPSKLEDLINVNLENKFKEMTVQVPWKNTIIDLSLLHPPLFAENYFSFGLKGEFKDKQNPVSCPFTPTILPTTTGNQMLQYLMSDYVPNCAGLVLYKQGALEKTITQQDLPADSLIQLNTTFFQYIIPNLYKKYPNRAIELKVYAAEPPKVDISKQGLHVKGVAAVNVSAVVPPKNQYAFTLDAVLIADLSVSVVKGNLITGDIHTLVCNVTVDHTNIGPIDIVPIISFVINPACNTLIPSFLNTFLNAGIPLPAFDGFQVEDAIIDLNDGYVAIGATIGSVH